MSDTTLLALLVGPLGALGAVYIVTALAATLYGTAPLSPTLRRLGSVDDGPVPGWQRVGRVVLLVAFLAALEAAVAVALVERRTEFDAIAQMLLLTEPIGAFCWVAYLIRLYRRGDM